MLINNYYDFSFRSIDFLFTRIKVVLSEKFGCKNFFCPDSCEVNFGLLEPNDVVDVILLGSFLGSFFESGNWPFERMRFWVLSEKVKQIICNEFGLDEKRVSVIPRDVILEAKNNTDKIDWENGVSLVYSGRLNRAKNIDLLLYTVNSLQKDFNKNVDLSIIGEFDQQEKVYVEFKDSSESYEKQCVEIINKLDWNIRPTITPFKERDNWTNIKSKYQTVLISLSTNMFEDYGVSVQQGLNAGWAVIVSSWGGHLDIRKNVTFIPYDYLTQFNEAKLRGRHLAKFLLNSTTFCNGESDNEIIKPKETISKYLREKRLSAVLHLNKIPFLSARREWNEMFFYREGISLISRYKDAFSSCSDKYVVVIVDDFYNASDTKKINYLRKIFEEAIENGEGVILFSFIEIAEKENWMKLLTSRKVYIAIDKFNIKLENLYQAILNCLSKDNIELIDG
ncbi:glycosyltransferase [Bacteriovoracaceae bacterium]|nr:glycosyltransferase [Bacteriovoracaceae bacterium]